MGLFSRRQQHTDQPPPPSTPAQPAQVFDVNAALETILVGGLKSSMDVVIALRQQAMEEIKLAQEMRTNMSRRLGGKVRAKTAKRSGDGKMRADCRLCENENISNPTADEIRKHATHAVRPQPKFEPVPVEIQRTQGGDEVIECESCGTSHAHGEHLN
jgi:hypothetical protein